MTEEPIHESTSLSEALDKYEVPLPNAIAEKVDRYATTLWEMNKKLNLTRHTTYDKFVARDVIDSVALAGLIRPEEEILDLGTGGGVPGILLAILRPDIQVALCDSVAKKANAVHEIINELELPIPVHHGKGQHVLEDLRFDTVVCRAVAPLKKLLTWVEPHWLSMNKMLVIKGAKWSEERNEARHFGLLNKLELRNAHEYMNPGNDSPSVVLKIWPSGRKEP
ncbi:MAG: 16S rRNA (guanine(527)-N(7))-methyltransferase RsmG [Pirellulales bacterium]